MYGGECPPCLASATTTITTATLASYLTPAAEGGAALRKPPRLTRRQKEALRCANPHVSPGGRRRRCAAQTPTSHPAAEGGAALRKPPRLTRRQKEALGGASSASDSLARF